MKTFKKSYLSVAVAAAASCVSLSAIAQILDEPPMGDSPTNTGQLATAYYVAQPVEGWQTFVNITNTTNKAIAV
ncbi:hypothetical protein [Thiohalocapsa marina]